MAILFADHNTELKCEKCEATTFEEIPVYEYKRDKSKISKPLAKGETLKRQLVCIKLKCSICGQLQNTINDIQRYNIIEEGK